MYWDNIVIESDIYAYEYFLQKDICRLCWSKNANIEIFEENFENNSQKHIIDIIKDCLQIELLNVDPKKLCESCSNEVNRFYSFKRFCNETDNKLKEILLKGLEELQNKRIDVNTVKDEVVDVDFNFDGLGPFIEDTADCSDDCNVNTLISHAKFRQKYSHKRTPTYCNLCCLELGTKEKLSLHNSEFHGCENDGTVFKCFGCEKRFRNKKLRTSHEHNFCKQLRDGYKCNICDRYLPKRCMYEYHMRDHLHNTLTELPELIFKCRKCVSTFKSKELLKDHMSEHEKSKNFICDICGRIFTRQDYLHKHKLTHTGVKPYECSHCDFKTVQRSSLTTHIRKHTGDRPYSCDMCPQKCISSSNLRAHRRRHLGVKKYECAICNKKFGYKISLEEHISSAHVRSESHPCEHCGATYTRVRGLKRHLAAKHGKENSKTITQNVLIQVI